MARALPMLRSFHALGAGGGKALAVQTINIRVAIAGDRDDAIIVDAVGDHIRRVRHFDCREAPAVCVVKKAGSPVSA